MADEETHEVDPTRANDRELALAFGGLNSDSYFAIPTLGSTAKPASCQAFQPPIRARAFW